MTTPKNHGAPWTNVDVQRLRELAAGNTPTRIIALKMGRTPEAVSSEAAREGITLKPVNQSPYNRQK